MPAADYCRYMAQFSFAADRNLGDILSSDMPREADSGASASH